MASMNPLPQNLRFRGSPFSSFQLRRNKKVGNRCWKGCINLNGSPHQLTLHEGQNAFAGKFERMKLMDY